MQISMQNANFLLILTCWLNDLENWKIDVAIQFNWKQFGEVIMVG
jgi:hypothetical protein